MLHAGRVIAAMTGYYLEFLDSLGRGLQSFALLRDSCSCLEDFYDYVETGTGFPEGAGKHQTILDVVMHNVIGVMKTSRILPRSLPFAIPSM